MIFANFPAASYTRRRSGTAFGNSLFGTARSPVIEG